MVNFLVFLPVWGLRFFLLPERDAKFYNRCGFHVLMPVRKQNTAINSSDNILSHQVSVFTLDY